jgi:hypothetical protein
LYCGLAARGALQTGGDDVAGAISKALDNRQVDIFHDAILKKGCKMTGRLIVLSAVGFLVLACSVPCRADQDCSKALVSDSYSESDTASSDFRLSTTVDESNYNSLSQKAGASGVIYGVPVGANWGEYKENRQHVLNSSDMKLSTDQARNVIWTSLKPEAVSAYEAC